MRNHLAIVAVLATACTGDAGTKDSGATDTALTNCDNFYDGAVSIDVATVDCNGNEVTYYAETTGWTLDGTVFTQETGNADQPYAQWSDEHDLISFEWDECGAWDHLRARLQDGDTLNDPLNDWEPNESSLFQCDAHYEDGNVITFAFAVYDDGGQIADCVAYGDDPNGMINGSYDRVNAPSFNLSVCSIGVNTL